MSQPYSDLIVIWAVCISWSAVFLTAVSIYLYVDSRKAQMKSRQATANRFNLARDFVFVWVLLGLLGLYIVSIDRGSSITFAAGNIIVEALLIVYTVRNRTSKGPETQKPLETPATC